MDQLGGASRGEQLPLMLWRDRIFLWSFAFYAVLLLLFVALIGRN